MINAGTAGGYKSKGAAIGDVFIGSHIRHHDRRIPIPGFQEYGIGDHHGLTIPHIVEVSHYYSIYKRFSTILKQIDVEIWI